MCITLGSAVALSRERKALSRGEGGKAKTVDKNDANAPVGDTFLVVELGYRRTKGDRQLTCVTSIAGRESVSIRRWRLADALPSPAQIEDLTVYMDDTIIKSVLAYLGIQQDLPM